MRDETDDEDAVLMYEVDIDETLLMRTHYTKLKMFGYRKG